jgi:tryptophan synthase beta chain
MSWANTQRVSMQGWGRPGVLQGTMSYVLQDNNGQVAATHSISAGLDYPSIGPEHAFLHDAGRVEYVSVSDSDALEAFQLLSKLEGIIPARRVGAHAVAHANQDGSPDETRPILIVNLSGRGDKDIIPCAKSWGRKRFGTHR